MVQRSIASWWLAMLALAGCSKGLENSASVTFGPVGPSGGNSTTTGSFDPTTSGDDRGDDTTGRPSDGTGSGGDDGTETTEGPGVSTTGDDPPGSDSSTGPSGPTCGDAVAEPGEDCDTDDLGGLTCPDVDPMFTGGTLACDTACSFDTSGCSTADNPVQVCQVVNATIPDNSLVGLSDTITLPAEFLGSTITDVNVLVEIDHTYIGDLIIDVSTGGTSVLLYQNNCGTEDNMNAIYDDEASGTFACGSSDSGLSFMSVGRLSSFNGATVGASWSLFVEDTADFDIGTLDQWCVTVSWE